jgi:glycosyltransferase involved in cell wall biosynthesis
VSRKRRSRTRNSADIVAQVADASAETVDALLPGSGLRLGYLALETPHEGQAAHTHIHAIIAGLEAEGWQVERFFATRSGASSGRSAFARLFDYIAVQARLIRAMRRLDGVYVRAHPAALPTGIAAWLMKKPIMHEINGPHNDLTITYPRLKPLAWFIAACQRAQYNRANHLVAVTPGLVAWAKGEAAHNRVTLVPNGVDTNIFTPDGPRHDIGKPYVAFVGGLVKWHGIATMLNALAHADWPKGVALVVVGDGVERERLAAAEADNMPGLIWLRRLPQSEVPAILRGAIAGLVPIENPGGRSDTGVLPLKLYETMACGIPVIATNLPGQRDLVREEAAGLLVPPADAKALARAVARLASDPVQSKRTGRQNSIATQLRHDWKVRARHVSSLLKKAFNQ